MARLARELNDCTEKLRRAKPSQDVREQRTLAKVVTSNYALLHGISSVYKGFLVKLKGHLADVDDRSPSDQPAEEKDEHVLSALQQKIEMLAAVSAGYTDVEKQVSELEEFKSKYEDRFQGWRRHENLRETP